MGYAIHHMRCEALKRPLGVDVPAPRLSWMYEGDVEGVAEIRVIVRTCEASAEEILWDSGWRKSDQTAIDYAGQALRSAMHVEWKAMTRIAGHPQTQAVADSWFETGLLQDSEWHGTWIRADTDCDSPVMVRTFELARRPDRARIYLCGLGVFELFVNGRRAGDEVLQPVLTAYSRQPQTNMLYPYRYQGAFRTPYRVFCLEDWLIEGENTLEIRLGNGWYCQKERRIEGDLWYGESPVLKAELRLDEVVLYTDLQWQWHESQTVRNNLFFGEETDLRRKDFPLRSVCTAKAPDGALRAQLCPSDAAMEAYGVVQTFPAKNGGVLLDFGQNLSGWVEVTANAQFDDRLELRFAEEVMAEGECWKLDYDSAGGSKQIQMDAFIFSGDGEENVHPHFCWHGYRYAEAILLRGGKQIPLSFEKGNLKASGFCGRLVSRFVTIHQDVTGQFGCDQQILDWYHRATLASLRSNEHCGVPLDCPHRERLGYTGDGQVTAEAILMNLDSEAFLTKWMRDIFDAQNRQTGHVPHTAPFYNGGGGPGGWGGAVVFVPWELYRFTGNQAILQEAWLHVVKWMEYLNSRSEDGIVTHEEEGGWCLGEWCVPGEIKIEPAFVNTALTIAMLQRVVRMAAVLKLPEHARFFEQERSARIDALNRHFYHPQTAGYSAECQGSEALALWCGAVAKGERPRVMQKLLRDLQMRDGRFDTGIFTTPILLELLEKEGEWEATERLMLSTGFPSFDFMRQNGATTLYESWNGGGSHNHAMFGAADVYLYRFVAGIAQADDSVGWRRVVFRPGMPRKIARAEATVSTPLGVCGIRWERRDGKLIVKTQKPTLCEAELLVPDGRRLSVPCGKHTFMLEVH